MFAYSIPNQRFTLAVSDYQDAILPARFVCIDTTGDARYAEVGDVVIGVSMNQAKTGEPLEIYDGIVLVEAAAAIASGDIVEATSDGKALASAYSSSNATAGIAISSVDAAGKLVAVKICSAANLCLPNFQTLEYRPDVDLAAADNLEDVISALYAAGRVVRVTVISMGTAVGIDASNTSVFQLKAGATVLAEKIFNGSTHSFPVAGTSTTLTLTEAATVGAILNSGTLLTLTVTNGATADLPKFMVQVVVQS